MFAIYLPKREETHQTNGFSTQNHSSALRMFLNLGKSFALLIHVICAKIMCVQLQGRILKSSIKFSTLVSNLLEDSEKPL